MNYAYKGVCGHDQLGIYSICMWSFFRTGIQGQVESKLDNEILNREVKDSSPILLPSLLMTVDVALGKVTDYRRSQT